MSSTSGSNSDCRSNSSNSSNSTNSSPFNSPYIGHGENLNQRLGNVMYPGDPNATSTPVPHPHGCSCSPCHWTTLRAAKPTPEMIREADEAAGGHGTLMRMACFNGMIGTAFYNKWKQDAASNPSTSFDDSSRLTEEEFFAWHDPRRTT